MNFNFSKKILASVGFKKDHGLLYVKRDTEHLGWVATVDHGTQQMNKIEYGVIDELMNPGVWKSIKSRSLEEFLIEVGNIKVDFIKRMEELKEHPEVASEFGWDADHLYLLDEVNDYPVPYEHEITSMQHNFKMIKLLPKEEQKEIQRQHREELRKQRIESGEWVPKKRSEKSTKGGSFVLREVKKPKFRHYDGELWACMDQNKDVYLSNVRPELDHETGLYHIDECDGKNWLVEADLFIKDLTYEMGPVKLISFIAKEQPKVGNTKDDYKLLNTKKS